MLPPTWLSGGFGLLIVPTRDLACWLGFSRLDSQKTSRAWGLPFPTVQLLSVPLLTASDAAGDAAGDADAGISPWDEPLPPEEPLPRELRVPAEEDDPSIPAAAGPAQPSCVVSITSRGGGAALAGPSSCVDMVPSAERYRGVPNQPQSLQMADR